MKFRIKWRNPSIKGPMITGLSVYENREAADTQIKIWSKIWPYMSYYLEPVGYEDHDWWGMTSHE